GDLLNDGTVTIFNTDDMNKWLVSGGRLIGNGGIFTGPIYVNGQLAPGNSAGVLTFDDLYMGSTSVTEMEIFGTECQVEYDQLVINGKFFADGTLKIIFGRGFVPQPGMEFLLFNVSPDTGWIGSAFREIAYEGLPVEMIGLMDYPQPTGMLHVIPEPATMALLGLGSVLLLRCRRRR
nr:PEP-CTERM sorting domain-containing protein [Planctomycetota bacterium]